MQKLLPDQLLAKGKITLKDVELNAYEASLESELSRYGKEALLDVYRDMVYLREFEKVLEISRKEGLLGYKFSYASHLAIGQEAVAVGEALALRKEDIIFGTHRSHGEFLAKSLRAIRLMSDSELQDVLENYPTPTYDSIKNSLSGSAKERALDFILYGAYAEIFARTSGLQRGLGGSMHLHFTPFGVYPSNAIVGGSAPLAVGGALYNRINGKDGIVVANVGDGALNCGAVYEAIALATMNQYSTLWAEKKGLPLLFVVSDNLYARGGNTKTETGSYDNPARLGAGFTSNQMNAESVNGLDPLAVADAVSRARQGLERGKGATLLNAVTYRHSEHSIGDNPSRDSAEVDAWLSLDPLLTYPQKLIDAGLLTLEDKLAIEHEAHQRVMRAYSLATRDDISPKQDFSGNAADIESYAFNGGHTDNAPSSYDFSDNSEYTKLLQKGGDLTLRDALTLGVIEGFKGDDTLVAYGEDVRGWNSPNSVFYGLDQTLPYERLFNTPISESAIVGAEVGYAMRGGTVLAELLYADFLTRSADEIINQSAKWQSLSGGTLKLPLTLRLPVGRSYGGQHSQDLSGLIARVPGLKVYYPVTPYDALATMRECLRSTDPSIIFEPKEYYGVKEDFTTIPMTPYPLEPTSKKASGNYATIVAIGSVLYSAISAVKASGKALDVFSLVSLSPVDYAPIVDSVKATGKLIVCGESTLSGGLMTDIVATIQKECFGYLKAPIEIVSLPNSIIPPSGKDSGIYELEAKILKAINKF
ncbi:MAG: dehydrogenase [Clostridia bacterium]|nr:dehydrogenase [Clostridia bacterium]